MLTLFFLLCAVFASPHPTDEECSAPAPNGKNCKVRCCATRDGCEYRNKQCLAIPPELDECTSVTDDVCPSMCEVDGECCPEDHIFNDGGDDQCCEGVVTDDGGDVCNYKAPKLEECTEVPEDTCNTLCQRPDMTCCPDLSMYTTDGMNFQCCEGEVTYDSESNPVCNYEPDCSLITDPCNCLGLCGWSSSAEPPACMLGKNTNCGECSTQEACNHSNCQDSYCPGVYDEMRMCQCTPQCYKYENCCKDVDVCETEYCTMPEVEEVIGTGDYFDGHGYDNAFNLNPQDGFKSDSEESSVGVKFVEATPLKSMRFYPIENDEDGRLVGAKIQCSDDGTNWDDMATIEDYQDGKGPRGVWTNVELNGESAHKYYRVLFDGAANGNDGAVGEVKFCKPEKICLGEIRSKSLECLQEDNEEDCENLGKNPPMSDGICDWKYEADCVTFDTKMSCNQSKHCVWRGGQVKQCQTMSCDRMNNGKPCTRRCCDKRDNSICYWLPTQKSCVTVKGFYCPKLNRRECRVMKQLGAGCTWNPNHAGGAACEYQ